MMQGQTNVTSLVRSMCVQNPAVYSNVSFLLTALLAHSLLLCCLLLSVWFQGIECFSLLLVIVIQFCYHLSNSRVELSPAEKQDVYSVMLPRQKPVHSEVCSASYMVSFFHLEHKWNCKFSRGPAPPVDVSKRTRYSRNEGAVGDWFPQRVWQMLILED